MKKGQLLITGFILVAIGLGVIMFNRFIRRAPKPGPQLEERIELPDPSLEGRMSIEKALHERRSIRDYSPEPLTLAQISQLLWAAQGLTSPAGYRTAPSAGALYPLEVYLLAGRVEGLAEGIYKYIPQGHELAKVATGDKRSQLSRAALGQEAVQNAPAVMVIAAVYERTTGKYGERGNRYVHMEVGSAAQNVYLQAESLDLGTVFIGAFYDDQVKTIVSMQPDEQPLCLMPIGRR